MTTQQALDSGLTLADTVAANVRSRAAILGLNQRDISRHMGISPGAVQQRWHAGSRSWKLSDLEVLAPLLQCQPWELLKPIDQSGAPRNVRNATVAQLPRLDSNQQPFDYGTPARVYELRSGRELKTLDYGLQSAAN